MTPTEFTTAILPRDRRLAAFQLGATPYDVEAVGDPLDFAASWRVLQLGDVNALHSTISPNSYRRTREHIEADGEDRVGIFHIRRGTVVGTIDGMTVDVGPGDGMVWDLARPFALTSPEGLESDIFTLPRYMIEEVLPAAALAGPLPAHPTLALAIDHFHYLLNHAADIPDESASFHGRALRDMLAMTMQPIGRGRAVAEADMPIFHRILHLIDHDPSGWFDAPGLATTLRVPVSTLAATLAKAGGLENLIERRRLLAAYRLLSNPEETANVSVVAARCGFVDLPSFSRRFRRAFHISASELRALRCAYLPTWAGAYHLEENYGALRA